MDYNFFSTEDKDTGRQIFKSPYNSAIVSPIICQICQKQKKSNEKVSAENSVYLLSKKKKKNCHNIFTRMVESIHVLARQQRVLMASLAAAFTKRCEPSEICGTVQSLTRFRTAMRCGKAYGAVYFAMYGVMHNSRTHRLCHCVGSTAPSLDIMLFAPTL